MKFLLIALVSNVAIAYDGTNYEKSCSASSIPQAKDTANKLIMEAAREMQKGTGYMKPGKNQDIPILENLEKSVAIKNNKLFVQNKMEEVACSPSVYLAFVMMLQKAQERNLLNLSKESMAAYLPKKKSEQPDGYGVFGRFNADGAGGAAFYNEVGAGFSTHNPLLAQQGDMAQIDWKNGHGHLVLVDSIRQCKKCEKCPSVQSVCYWSANISNDTEYMGDGMPKKNGGWGMKCLPTSNIAHITVSHINHLENLDKAGELVGSNKSNPNYIQRDMVEGAHTTYAKWDLLTGIANSNVAAQQKGQADR